MKKIISLFLVLAILAASTPNVNASEKPFDINILQKAIKSLVMEHGEKKLYDTSLVSLSNQIIRLNKEIAAGKKLGSETDIKNALKNADAILTKLDTSKLSVYTKKTDTVKKDQSGVAETGTKITRIKHNLNKAMVYYGLKPQDGVAKNSNQPQDILFQIDNYSLTVSPQKINSMDHLASLIPDAASNSFVRYWPNIVFSFDKADSITVYDYYIDGKSPLLLFKKSLKKSQEDVYIYDIQHSSTSPNNPFGYNEIEERVYIFVITFAGENYAYPFKVSHDGSHN